MKVLFKNILIEPFLGEDVSEFGIIIPNHDEESPQQGKVIEVGDETTKVKKGDEVLFAKYTPIEIKVGDKESLIVKEEDILAILNADSAST